MASVTNAFLLGRQILRELQAIRQLLESRPVTTLPPVAPDLTTGTGEPHG